MVVRMALRFAIVVTAVLCFSASPLAAQGLPCEACGPGTHWVVECGVPGGGGWYEDMIANTGATVGIDTTGDCVADVSLIMRTCPNDYLMIYRSDPQAATAQCGASNLGCTHGVIDTEILYMCLEAQGYLLKAGGGVGGIPNAYRSLGCIKCQGDPPGDPTKADSFYDVFFELTLPGGTVAYNYTPLHVDAVIDCLPPQVDYLHPGGTCTPLYDAPPPGPGNWVANLVDADHEINRPVPTVTEWGLIVMTLLLLTAGTMVFRRRRAAALA